MNGLIVVDFREDVNGFPKATEINIRPLSFTSTLVGSGLNFPEFQMLLLTGQSELINPELTRAFSEDNAILRDVDGLPIYVDHLYEKTVGEYGLIEID